MAFHIVGWLVFVVLVLINLVSCYILKMNRGYGVVNDRKRIVARKCVATRLSLVHYFVVKLWGW